MNAWRERFWAKVDRTPTCWIWRASRWSDGYGQFRLPDRRLAAAHRLAWELENGPIPAGLHVLHSCDNPPCVNPAHLRLGSNGDNIADRVSKGRSVVPLTAGNRRLRANDVIAMRDQAAMGVGTSELASRFAVGTRHVRRITAGQRWAHEAVAARRAWDDRRAERP